MEKKLKGVVVLLILTASLTACGKQTDGNNQIQEETIVTENTKEVKIEGASYLKLSDEEITLDEKAVTTSEQDAVYVANDIIYYEEGKDFTYGAGSEADAHSEKEAGKHTIVHITKPGTYVVSGTLSAGQIAIDLGEDAKDDPKAVVTLVLNNVDITCSVAPAVIFYNVYECCSDMVEEATKDVDTQAAGANVLIADGTVNTIKGSYVAKIYKSVELNEDKTEVVDSKKLHKYDGAFYSKMSMNVKGGEVGDGMLNIYADNEGLDSELHLTIDGGNISIVSGNDGINTNEDNVSVTTINGGYLSIQVDGATKEGDGIDSNGWIVINGGMVTAAACSDSMDAGIDSDNGIYVNGGTVIASGNMYDTIEEGNQNFAVFSFQEKVKSGTEITLKKGEESFFITMPNDFTYLVISQPELEEGTYTLWLGEKQISVVTKEEGFEGPGMGHPEGERPELPEGKRPELPEGERPELPEGERPELPEGMEEGAVPPMPPNGPGAMEINLEDAAEEFEIKTGSNYFIAVAQNQ